jgi:hypothetical protein
MLGEAVSANSWKSAVRAASIGANLTLVGLQTVDTVVLAAGDTILVKDQTLPIQNGIYLVSSTNWQRYTTMLAGSAASGATVFVAEGSITNNGKMFVCTDAPGDDVVGTNDLTFVTFVSTVGAAGSTTQVQYNTSGELDASAGLTFSGGVLTAASGLVATSGGVTATAGGVTATAGGVTATAGGVTATAGNITATAGSVVVSTATQGLTLTSADVAVPGEISVGATVTARQGTVTFSAPTTAADTAVESIITAAVGLAVTATSVVIPYIEAYAGTGTPVVRVKSRGANTFTLTVTNVSAVDPFGGGAMSIGYIIM